MHAIIVHVNSNIVDCDERVNGQYRQVKEAEVAFPVVAALEMVMGGGQ